MISTISAHGRALKPPASSPRVLGVDISTISAHGRALKPNDHPQRVRVYYAISTISAHGRALKLPPTL